MLKLYTVVQPDRAAPVQNAICIQTFVIIMTPDVFAVLALLVKNMAKFLLKERKAQNCKSMLLRKLCAGEQFMQWLQENGPQKFSFHINKVTAVDL